MPKKGLASARSEAAEALWFEKNQDQLMRLFEEAGRKGTLAYRRQERRYYYLEEHGRHCEGAIAEGHAAHSGG